MNSTSRRLAGIAVFALLCSAGCTHVPPGVVPVSNFDVARYMGRWYEVARLENSFEKGLEQVTADYALQPDGTVAVVNRGFARADGEWREARGKAKFTGRTDVGALKVSFFGPFYGGYNVIDLDAAYTTALVVGSNRSYLWILSRTPDPPRATIARLVAKATQLGYAGAAVVYAQPAAMHP